MRHTVTRRLDYNVELAEKLKNQGLDLACSTRPELVRLARELSVKIAHKYPFTVNMDQVMDKLSELGYRPEDLGNAAGRIFAGKKFIPVGRVKSKRISNHGRSIVQWSLP